MTIAYLLTAAAFLVSILVGPVGVVTYILIGLAWMSWLRLRKGGWWFEEGFMWPSSIWLSIVDRRRRDDRDEQLWW